MDYSTIPVTVTIKNLNVAPTEEEVKANKDVVAERTETVQLFRVNTFVELKAEEELKLTVNDSKEVAYYAALATDKIEVTVA